MKKNDRLSDGALEKVSAGYGVEIPESIVVPPGGDTLDNDYISFSTGIVNQDYVHVNVSEQKEDIPLKTNQYDLHTLSDADLNTQSRHQPKSHFRSGN